MIINDKKNIEKEYSDILTRLPWESTKEEIQLIFSPFALDIKEWEKYNDKISFELHWKRLFLIRYNIESSGLIHIQNEFILTTEGDLRFVILNGHPNNAGMVVFLINFCINYEIMPNSYSPDYKEGVSHFYSEEDMKYRLELVQVLLEKYKE